MNNLTINEVVNFFRSLDLKKRIEVLHELTIVLNNGVQAEPSKGKDVQERNEERAIDEMFGMWKDETELNEESILKRTTSSREIRLD